jgi:hypothetical protein
MEFYLRSIIDSLRINWMPGKDLGFGHMRQKAKALKTLIGMTFSILIDS